MLRILGCNETHPYLAVQRRRGQGVATYYTRVQCISVNYPAPFFPFWPFLTYGLRQERP